MAESVASLVERLEKRAQYYENASKQIPSALVSSIQRETAQELREAASRLSSGTANELKGPARGAGSALNLKSEQSTGNFLPLSSPEGTQESDHRPSDREVATFDGVKRPPSGDEPGRIPWSSPEGTRGEPVAWLHTLHMELEQTDKLVTLTKRSPFGKRGVDYDKSYRVTSEPLALSSPSSAPAATPEDEDEAVRANWPVASPRVSAATPAPDGPFVKLCVESIDGLAFQLSGYPDGETHPNIDAIRNWCDRLRTALRLSAAERPAPTCATCSKWLMMGWPEETSSVGECHDASVMATNANRPPMTRDTFGCTLYEPAPPGQVAQGEK